MLMIDTSASKTDISAITDYNASFVDVKLTEMRSLIYVHKMWNGIYGAKLTAYVVVCANYT